MSFVNNIHSQPCEEMATCLHPGSAAIGSIPIDTALTLNGVKAVENRWVDVCIILIIIQNNNKKNVFSHFNNNNNAP